jgi:hypothetical protein
LTDTPYKNGFSTIVEQWQSRREPLKGADKWLPSANCDLQVLAETLVTEQSDGGVGYRFKKKQVSGEFIGKSDLCLLTACLIAVLRKREWPDHAPDLFCRIWAEHSDHLLDGLDWRWKVSATTTFGDHGQTEEQRRLGQSLSVMFGMMKLYESERLFTGSAPTEAFKRGNRRDAELPLGMDSYSIRNGGLDVNLLAPLWKQALDEPVMGALAQDLLTKLIGSDDTVFARFAEMRRRMNKDQT